MIKGFKIALTAFIVTVCIVKGAPALAAPPVQNVSIVRTTDLDLTSRAGRAALDHRLVSAAADVCGTASNADLVGSNKVRECRADVLAKARADTAQLASRGGPIAVVAAR